MLLLNLAYLQHQLLHDTVKAVASLLSFLHMRLAAVPLVYCVASYANQCFLRERGALDHCAFVDEGLNAWGQAGHARRAAVD